MKFLHTGDLHIGKVVNDFSMLEDQGYILKQIRELAVREKADALVIAGDIYDRAIPPADAVVLLDDFLTDMVKTGIPVLMVSGNHDSPERVGFAGAILEGQGLHIAGIYEDRLKEVTLKDKYGKVTFVLMPYVKPAAAGAKNCGEAVEKMLYGQEAAKCMRCAEAAENVEHTETVKSAGSAGNRKCGADRRVLVTHYFVTDHGREPELSEGETTIHVGGLDNVEASLFDGFDYVALGHIHKPQRIGQGQVYYAGAPLAYSFSETGQEKYVNLVELGEKGEAKVKKLQLQPLHGIRRIKGRLEELMQPDIVEAADNQDYIQAELTNEEELIDPIGTLRTVYPNIMQIVLTKNEKKDQAGYVSRLQEKRKSIPELFEGFYQMIREEAPDEERKKIIEETAKQAEGEAYYET